ncbi:hypothetical protein [Sphingobium lignivorans]|uniref:hypothetical protein n=1 Tax=Sphingobium lignivorans TaxID=2735886 RepID=UPI0016148957|nr:hypothetical protein [Sphingobium lignivorans]
MAAAEPDVAGKAASIFHEFERFFTASANKRIFVEETGHGEARHSEDPSGQLG